MNKQAVMLVIGGVLVVGSLVGKMLSNKRKEENEQAKVITLKSLKDDSAFWLEMKTITKATMSELEVLDDIELYEKFCEMYVDCGLKYERAMKQIKELERA